MKNLTIPYIDALNSAKIENAAVILEEQGKEGAIDQLNWAKEFPYRPLTSFHIGHSNDAIYIKYNVHGSMLRAIYTKDQDPVYEDSSVEFFCRKDNDDYYYNFIFNCIGTCRATKRKSKNDDVQLMSTDDLAKIERYSSIGRRAFKELEGMFTWDLTVKIPYSVLDFEKKMDIQKLSGNFYKCADGTGSPHFLSWSPIKTEKPDFHRPEFFGDLYIE